MLSVCLSANEKRKKGIIQAPTEEELKEMGQIRKRYDVPKVRKTKPYNYMFDKTPI